MGKSTNFRKRTAGLLLMLLGLSWACGTARAWDSRSESGQMLGIPMHLQFTALAAKTLRGSYPELYTYFAWMAAGCLTELHELPTKDIDVRDGQLVGLDLNAKRVQHQGTNEGCNDMQGWWNDALSAYRSGYRARAYFIVGIMMHMAQDMGVPAHANRVYHQGNLTEFDNFEWNAATNGSYITSNVPSITTYDALVDNLNGSLEPGRINLQNPLYGQPWKYYAFSQNWNLSEGRKYPNRDFFPKSRVWPFWDANDREWMKDRQNRTYAVTLWMMESAVRAFQNNPWPN